MRERHISIAALYDEEGKLLLQYRRGLSPYDEDWSFFGGGVEEGESAEEGLIREIEEEIGVTLEKPVHLGTLTSVRPRIKPPLEEVRLVVEVFAHPMPCAIPDICLMEGDGFVLFARDRVIDLHTPPFFNEVLTLLDRHLTDALK
ncbi:MAG: NUDIX hydrolase [archaeon]